MQLKIKKHTRLRVTISSYAFDIAPAIIPEPRKFSTPIGSSRPKNVSRKFPELGENA